MSREEMLEVIQEGGSVLHGNRIIVHPDQVPTEADIAKHDAARAERLVNRADPDDLETLRQAADLAKQAEAREHAAAESLRAQIKKLQDDLAGVKPTPAPAPTPVHPVAPAVAPAVKVEPPRAK